MTWQGADEGMDKSVPLGRGIPAKDRAQPWLKSHSHYNIDQYERSKAKVRN